METNVNMNLLNRLTNLITPIHVRQLWPLKDLAAHVGIPESTLRRAALDERLEAHKIGKMWVSTPAAVQRAQDAGRLRRK